MADRPEPPEAASKDPRHRTWEERTQVDVHEFMSRVAREEPAWNRLEGETAKQFAAFELYRQLSPSDRTVAAVARALNSRSMNKLYQWCGNNHWRARALAWDEHQAVVQQRAAEQAIRSMTEDHCRSLEYVTAIANLHLDRTLRQLRSQATTDENFVPDFLDAKDIISWVKNAQTLEVSARQRNLELTNPNRHVGSNLTGPGGKPNSLEAWHKTYVEPERTFVPHKKQRAMIHSTARFVVSVAGVQSGKTSGTAIKFWKRILSDRRELRRQGEVGFYWLIAPNSIVGEVMREAFVQFAPPGEIVGHNKTEQTWTLSDGGRVQFRSAEKSETLVARRLDGAWLDEFTLMKPGIWLTSLRQRFVTRQGWCLFSGTPRGKNWAWDEIWRRCLRTDDISDPDYEGFTWHSEENPLIPQEEIEAAKRQLPIAYFNREYRAAWESFHGQIYQAWSTAHQIKGLASKPMPLGTYTVMGVDWGFAAPGCVVVVRVLPGGQRHIVEEVYAADQLPSWWNAKIEELWRKHRVKTIWADPEDAGRIAELKTLGMPIKRANNEVHRGIRTVAKLINQALLMADKKKCPVTCQQLEAYHWKENRRGVRSEHPAKENDHACDAVRYAVQSDEEGERVQETSGYGSAKKPGR